MTIIWYLFSITNGIKLKRTKNWSIQQKDDFLKPGIILFSSEENNADNFREQVKVSVENLSTPLSLEEYTEQAVKEIEHYNSIIESPKDITLANRKGKKVIYQEQNGIKHLEVWTMKNHKVYIITYTEEPEKFNKFLKPADKIIQFLTISN